MPEIGGVKGTQTRAGEQTLAIKNQDGEMIAWDLIREACDLPCGRRDYAAFLTIPEASRKWKVSTTALYSKAKRNGWRLVAHHQKQRVIAKEEKTDWGKLGDKHREKAFQIGHESLKRFKARAPKNFRELDIADRIARRAAGLENDAIVQQTLVHVNEAVEDHADAQVIEASSKSLPDIELSNPIELP